MTKASEKSNNELYFRHWPAEGDTKATVMLIHGLGEHCQRYQHLAQYLNNAGYSLSSMDLPCHGKSKGLRVLGHSMGGLIATRLLLNHQEKFQAAMLSGAAIQSPQEPPAWQVVIIKSIAKLFPKAKMLALDASAVSRDPEVVEKYMADPLISKDKLSAQFLVSMTNAMQECKDNAQRISLPLRIMHGSADVMTAPEGSEFLHNSVSI